MSQERSGIRYEPLSIDEERTRAQLVRDQIISWVDELGESEDNRFFRINPDGRPVIILRNPGEIEDPRGFSWGSAFKGAAAVIDLYRYGGDTFPERYILFPDVSIHLLNGAREAQDSILSKLLGDLQRSQPRKFT